MLKGTTKNAKGYTFDGWVDEDGSVVDSAADAAAGKTYAARWLNSHYYYYSGSSTTSNTPNKSPKTADAGIALYAGMAAASLLGSGVVLNRKRKSF